MRGQTYSWGTVAQLLERTTDDRVVAASNPTGAAWKLWAASLAIHFTSLCQWQCLSEETIIHWSLLSGLYARGSKRAHTAGNCVTCRGLYILPGQ